MPSKVVPFVPAVPPKADLQKKVRKLAEDSANVRFDIPHCRQRMEERDISMRQVLVTLRTGSIDKKPERDPDTGEVRVRMKMTVAGVKIRVVVEVSESALAVVTVI